jgi:hypothetical protein
MLAALLSQEDQMALQTLVTNRKQRKAHSCAKVRREQEVAPAAEHKWLATRHSNV